MGRYEEGLEAIKDAQDSQLITVVEAERLQDKYLDGLISTEDVLLAISLGQEHYTRVLGLASHELVELTGHERAYIEELEEVVEATVEATEKVNNLSGAFSNLDLSVRGPIGEHNNWRIRSIPAGSHVDLSEKRTSSTT